MAKSKSEPTGKEIMKRSFPTHMALRPTRFEFDPKKAYSPGQLAEIGAIALKWNQLETSIDFICSHILFTKNPIWLKFSLSRKFSTARKTDLLEEGITHAELLDDKTKICMSDSMSCFKAYRHYRNAIVHHHIYDHEKGIGSFIDESNKAFQIMVSLEALQNFYNLLCALHNELREVDMLFRIETGAQRPIIKDDRTGETKPYPTKQLREQVIPGWRKELIARQKQRKSLPPLPKFPDADVIRALWEEQTRHLDPEEKYSSRKA